MNQNNQIQNSIFWVETEKIKPNPFQPRHEFDESRLRELSESIRQYGVLQPLVVVRCEHEVPNGTAVNYELIAGERRLRASKLAGLLQVPVIIRAEPAEKVKLELALVENVQREDLGPIERAIAFKQMADTFGMKQREIAAKIGKSREFVANTMRLLVLPEEIKQALVDGSINEGHTRPLLMLSDKPEAQKILFKDIVYKKLSVRDAEHAARRIAYERARKQDGLPDQNTRVLEEKLAHVLGTRVAIERRGLGGVIAISFFSDEELRDILAKVDKDRMEDNTDIMPETEAVSSEDAPKEALLDGNDMPPVESHMSDVPVQLASALDDIVGNAEQEKVFDSNTLSGVEKDALDRFTI